MNGYDAFHQHDKWSTRADLIRTTELTFALSDPIRRQKTMKNSAVLIALMTLALGACSSTPTTPESDGAVTKESVSVAIKAAEDAYKRAEAVDGEWRDTEKLIKDAKTALEKGELDKAMSAAKEAEMQGKLAEQQAKDQKNAKPWLF
jgi:hypothetical protein